MTDPHHDDAPHDDAALRTALDRVRTEVGKAVVGQDGAVTGLIIALLADGHVLLEGVPGVAKTLLVRTLSRTLRLETRRVQFTPDLMPGDITGSLAYDPRSGEFAFREGPVFTNLLLADEINRTPPKTQSALLEAMEERQVSVDGVTRPLPAPFLVAATQNPIEYEGTYALPEAQLDRFLVKTSLGYPDHDTAVTLLLDSANRARASKVSPIIASSSVTTMAHLASEVHVDAAVLSYLNQIVSATRDHRDSALGVSMRGALALARTAKTWAISRGRTYVTPDDVRELAAPVLAHRIIVDPESEFAGVTAEDIVARVVADVAPPAYRAA